MCVPITARTYLAQLAIMKRDPTKSVFFHRWQHLSLNYKNEQFSERSSSTDINGHSRMYMLPTPDFLQVLQTPREKYLMGDEAGPLLMPADSLQMCSLWQTHPMLFKRKIKCKHKREKNQMSVKCNISSLMQSEHHLLIALLIARV